MEEWRLQFPEVDEPSMVFGGYPRDWFDSVMKIESKPEDRKWNDMMESLFFNGGKVPVNETLPEEYRTNGLRMLRAVIGSFEPKHEHKEKVCGLILKSLCSY
ncbi:MAG: hypothetical protein WC477_06230 [Patescibacteria group bacterium]